MEHRRTVTEIKLSFIRDQIRVLSASLAPKEGWRDFASDVEDDIPDKVVDDVLQKSNNIFRQHHRAVFSTQATHHVVQQIERLYWDSVNPELARENAPGHVFEKGTDFSSTKTIARLPDQWTEDGVSEDVQARYRQLHERLVELDAHRRKQQQKVAQYKQLKALLEPFNDPQTDIQPNLVTRDGELGDELDRMRMLVAKVASRVEDAERDGLTREQEPEPSADHDAKLSALLDMT